MNPIRTLSRWRERAGLARIESLVLAAALALPAGGLVFASGLAFADGDEGEEHEAMEQGARHAPAVEPADAAAAVAMKNECGSCHVAFPTRLLPAASWQKIMGSLGDHYGTDATIDDAAVAAQITKYLVANAGDPARAKDVKGAAVPMRITETRWFVREHDEVRADAWKRPSIKSAANCGACHQGAAEGNFSERGIRIPKQ